MKTHANVLRVVLVDPPTSFEGMDNVEPMLDEKGVPRAGERGEDGNVRFETAYTCKQAFFGPAIRREKDGRAFVYIDWYGAREGGRTRFRRLKVHLDRVPHLVWDCEVTAAGRGPDGSPACATATILEARNIEDYLPPIAC